jgi:hypothetical protein
VIAAPGEDGLRLALQAAPDGGTVLLTTNVLLRSTVRIDRDVTIRYAGPRPYDNWIYGTFDGPLFTVAAPEFTVDGLALWGSPVSDAFAREGDGRLSLVNCVVTEFRSPITGNSWWGPRSTLRLEKTVIARNQKQLECHRLEARDCVFAENRSGGANAYSASIVRCEFTSNAGDGLNVTFATVRDSVFRYNSDFGLRFDPDPGVLTLSGCLFYANSGGGLLLREAAVATVDHCTFTRHTGPPAVVVSEASSVLFRHCTITDNLVLGGGQPGLWPSFPVGAALALMSGDVTLQNCLVADNTSPESTSASGLVGQWTDAGGNVIGGPARLRLVAGETSYAPFLLVPESDSPAIDAGQLSDLVKDARGRSREAGLAPDAGAIESGAGEIADLDADGIPDLWERFRGLNPADPSDAQFDADGDGASARSEYLAATNPSDPASVLRVEWTSVTANPLGTGAPYFQLRWPSAPGVEYRVEQTSDGRTWMDASGFLWPEWEFQTPVQPTPTFYRVTAFR